VTPEDRLRDAIHDYTDQVEPPDAWGRIRERTTERRHRPWWRFAIAGFAAVALAVTAVALVQLGGGDERRIETPAGIGDAPSQIVAVTAAGEVVVLDTATGERVRELADGADAETTLAVTPDGRAVWFDRPSGPDADPPRELVQVPTAGGAAEREVGGASQPAVSPDGRLLAFVKYSGPAGGSLPQSLLVVDLPSFDGVPNVVGGGTVGGEAQRIFDLWFAPDSRRLLYIVDEPRVTEIGNDLRLDQVPPIPTRHRIDGYLGATGHLLGTQCADGTDPDQDVQAVAIDAQSGVATEALFRLPAICGQERLDSDSSGDHILGHVSSGEVYGWSRGDSEPTKIADGILAAAWLPKSGPSSDVGDQFIAVPAVVGLQVADAVAALEAVGFTVEVKPDGATEGIVIRQCPDAGASVPPGTEVSLAVDTPADPEVVLVVCADFGPSG